jgi:hypothetical protein|tara:strand:- start:1730 stop:2395 length:666 start_codon:yes stop_codon:yes gene_type:complete
MNLSNDTIAIFKNFANINQNILVKPGKKLNTISTMKNILATADVKEDFEQEFAIYDLPEFLRTLDLFETPTLKFNGGSSVGISGKDGRSSSKYTFADKSVIVAPTKAISMPDTDITFKFDKANLNRLMKGVVTLNLPDIEVIGDGSKIKLVANDRKNKASNKFDIDIGTTDKTFKAYFKAENFKMIEDDYDVAISKQKISHFVNRNKPVQYWIALEPESEF